MNYTAEIVVEDHLLIVTVKDATGQVVDHIHDQVDQHVPLDLHEIILILRAIDWRCEVSGLDPTLEAAQPHRLTLPVARLPDPHPAH